MDGRDIGTVILPDAPVKIFMTASLAARVRRRTAELEAKGMPAAYEDVLREMEERDRNAREREIAPAVAAPDAVPLDNSEMTVEQNVQAVLDIVARVTGKAL